jgi:hypothetical protein
MITTYRTAPRTLHEYRLDYPRTASVATLTQSSMLWSLLERQRELAYARYRRGVQRRKILASIRYALAHPWRALSGNYYPPV